MSRRNPLEIFQIVGQMTQQTIVQTYGIVLVYGRDDRNHLIGFNDDMITSAKIRKLFRLVCYFCQKFHEV